MSEKKVDDKKKEKKKIYKYLMAYIFYHILKIGAAVLFYLAWSFVKEYII